MAKLEQIEGKRREAEDLRRQGIYISRSALQNMTSIRDILQEVPEDADDEILSDTHSLDGDAREKARDVILGEGGDLMARSGELAGEAAAEDDAMAEKTGKGKGLFARIAALRFGKGQAADGMSRAGLRETEYRSQADAIRSEADRGMQEYRELTREFDGFPADKYGYIGTTETAHAAFLEENETCEFVRYDQPRLETIPADRIEGVQVADREIENPEIFWNHHRNSKEKYTEMVSHIPEIRNRLASGETLDSIRQGASQSMAACVEYCFGNSRVEVLKADGYYSMQNGGRHRILMARQLGYDLSVKVIGELRRK